MAEWFTEDDHDHDHESSMSCVYIGGSPRSGDGALDNTRPQAFLVRYPQAIGPLRVHFHPVRQFQYFVRGRGRFGTHDVGPGSVHYADPFTPYGPLTALDDEVWFLTLRAQGDQGAFYMPESQPDLRAGRADDPAHALHRNVTADLAEADPGTVAAEDDGLAIETIDLAADQAVLIDGGPGGGYVVLVRGQLVDNGKRVGSSGVCVALVEEPTSVCAGPEGARVSVLRFPVAETAPR